MLSVARLVSFWRCIPMQYNCQKSSNFQGLSHFSRIFGKNDKIPGFFQAGKTVTIFPGFPGAVGTLRKQLYVAVADPEIRPRGGAYGSRNLQRGTAAMFFLTSFNRGRGPGPAPASATDVAIMASFLPDLVVQTNFYLSRFTLQYVPIQTLVGYPVGQLHEYVGVRSPLLKVECSVNRDCNSTRLSCIHIFFNKTNLALPKSNAQ